MTYRFGPFQYDLAGRCLRRGSDEMLLTPKSRALLVLFLRNPGRVLDREEIVREVWPDAAVSDDAVRFQISELRRALGVEGNGLIRTVPREGYRWEPPPEAAADPGTRARPPFRLVLETREVPLAEGEHVLGRDPDAAIRIDHDSVSRRHARIVVTDGKGMLEDLGSKNGTFLRGKRIRGVVVLSEGDKLRIGPETIVFRTMSSGTTRTERKTKT